MEPEKQRHIAKRRGCNRDRKSKYCLSTCALGKAVQSDSALFFSPSANWLTCLSTSAAESTAGCCLAWAGGKLVLFFHPLQVMNPVCSPHQLKPHEQLHRRAHSVSQFDGCLFPFPALFHSLSLSLSICSFPTQTAHAMKTTYRLPYVAWKLQLYDIIGITNAKQECCALLLKRNECEIIG